MTTMFEAGDVPQWTIGDRLMKAMNVNGISTQEMADYLGVSRNTVTNYTHDKTRVPTASLKLWALRTGIPLAWLETGVTPNPDGGDGTGLDSSDPDTTQE